MATISSQALTNTVDEVAFTVKGIDTRVANSLRRTVLSDIQCIVFKTSPAEENQCNITINTSMFHNEIIKQRLSCIPIRKPKEFKQISQYEMFLHVKNDTTEVINVTTADFRIRKIGGAEIDEAVRQQIFPPRQHKGRSYYINFLRLRPRRSESIPGEEIELSCRFSFGTAKESGMFNVVSKCTYIFTQAPVKDIPSFEGTEEEKERAEADWRVLDAKRHFIPESFDFVVKGIGIYPVKNILIMACKHIQQELEEIEVDTEDQIYNIQESDTSMPNCWDIVFANGDYTIGKILEYQLYKSFFNKPSEPSLQYVSFYKKHPHDVAGILRVSFVSPIEPLFVKQCLRGVCVELKELYTILQEQFKTL